MLDWLAVQSEYDEMSHKLSNPSLEQRERAELQKKATLYGLVLGLHQKINDLEASISESKKQAEQETGEMKSLFEEEVRENEAKLAELVLELDDMLYPANEHDSRSVFLEIRAGTGGQEAALFAADLFKMYSIYALAKGWVVSIVESSSTDIGGYKELIVHIKGKNVYRFLKFESGVHRVQRVPKTETAGRIHTSTVTVAVLPEVDDVDVNINPGDLRIDVYRSSGAGGQHVNTTDSAVRITHIPSGLVVTCQDERSQIKNKAKALKVLQSRLYDFEQSKRDAEISAQRKQQVGGGERAEKIRTYNFPQNRVTDHRTEITLKKLDMVMQGDLDDLIQPLLQWDVQQRREKGSTLISAS
jgi:peptide chain release factor 1